MRGANGGHRIPAARGGLAKSCEPSASAEPPPSPPTASASIGPSTTSSAPRRAPAAAGHLRSAAIGQITPLEDCRYHVAIEAERLTLRGAALRARHGSLRPSRSIAGPAGRNRRKDA